MRMVSEISMVVAALLIANSESLYTPKQNLDGAMCTVPQAEIKKPEDPDKIKPESGLSMAGIKVWMRF